VVLLVGSTAAASGGRALSSGVRGSQPTTVWVELDGTSSAHFHSPIQPATVVDWTDAESWHYVWKFVIPLPLSGAHPLVFTPYTGHPTSDSFLQVSSHITYGAQVGNKTCDDQSTTRDGHISRAPQPTFTYPAKRNANEEDFAWTIPDGALCGLAPWHLTGALPLAAVQKQVDLNGLRPGAPLDFSFNTPPTTVSNTELQWHGTLRITLTEPPLPGRAGHSTPVPIRLLALDLWNREVEISIGLEQMSDSGRALFRFMTPAQQLWFLGMYTETFKTEIFMLQALRLIWNDPPLAHDHIVARVAPAGSPPPPPSCTGSCGKLTLTTSALAAATVTTKSLAQAMAITVGRESAAAKAGDKKALGLQQRAALSLLPKLRAALTPQQAAGRNLAADLRAAKVPSQITAAQAGDLIAALLRKLAARGVPEADARSMSRSGELTPKPLDLFALLGATGGAAPAPLAQHPTITSVTFAGTPANPSIDIRGTNLGKLPAPSPAGHPSGQNGCPVVAGDNGYDYGTNFYVVGVSKGFAAGRHRPSLGETDCIDLVFTKFTSTRVDFHFGPFYTQNYPKYALNAGDSVQVVVNGASATVTVKYP
jgi:hypothetical protein